MVINHEVFGEFLEKYLADKGLGTTLAIDSLVVDYKALKEWNSEVAKEVLTEPDNCLPEFQKATSKFSGGEEIPISIRNLPKGVSLRDLGSNYLGKLILVQGIVNRVVPIRPLVTLAVFECKNTQCGAIKNVPQDEPFMVYPYICLASKGKGKDNKERRCRSKRFRFLEKESTFVDVQELRIQERPKDLPAGQLPRQVNLEIARPDLVNGARAGDIVDVVGILRTKASSPSSKKRKFAMFIDVNYIEALNKEISETTISSEEEQEICSLALRPDIYELIIQSIAPSIYGNHHIKEGIMYLLFGGTKKDKGDITIRGEMNVLLVGDPATAKSQLLQALANISPRGLYTSGRGTTAAGLTAAVNKVEGEVWALDAGALVLADKGICCIDEIDKMNENDRVAIHEAMAQHTVSINKAGINARLNARTAVLAAANPAFGRYQAWRTFAENLSNLPTTLLSRFDLIFIVRDELEDAENTALSSHILGLDVKKKEMIERELLKKYLAYARALEPKMTREAMLYLQKFFIEMREKLNNNGEDDNPVRMTPRQLESLIRISEAHAKIALKHKVDIEDALAAINIMTKSLKDVGIDPKTGKLDIDVIMTGKPKTVRDKMGGIMDILKDRIMHPKEEIIEIMSKRSVSRGDTERMLNQMMSEGSIYEPQQGFYQSTR